MNKSELIEKWQEKHSSLLSEYNQHHRGSDNITAEMENRSRMKDVLEFIEDIKQLNEATVNRSEVCPNCGRNEYYIENDLRTCKACLTYCKT